MSPTQFYGQMARNGFTMTDLMGFKADFIQQQADAIGSQQGARSLHSIPEALRSWNDNFGIAERRLLQIRRWGVEQAFNNAVRRYVQANPDFPYIVKMDVGSWATESRRDLRFEGDIDFSVLMSQVDNAVQLRNFYNAEIKQMFGMDMASLDAHATAQRKATADVYITQAGADWAEVDARRRGVLQEVDIQDGRVLYKQIQDPLVRSYIFANLKNNVQIREGGGDQLSKLMDDPPKRTTQSMEPAISLEMLRHMTTDAIQAHLAPHEKIIKIAKYVQRSAAVRQEAFAGSVLVDPALAAWAEGVTRIKQDRTLSGQQRLQRILDLSRGILGNPSSQAALERALNTLGNRSATLVRDNIHLGIDARMKAIQDLGTRDARNTERRKLYNDLQEIYKAYADRGVDFPPRAHETMIALGNALQQTVMRVPTGEIERMRRLLKQSADNPRSLQMSLAITWQRFSYYYTETNNKIDKFNQFLDYLDNNTMASLRQLNTELNFGGIGKNGRFAVRLPIPIGAINDRLNSSILGKIGDSVPFKAINLFQEGLDYWNAIARGQDWNESMTNFSTEIFRNHFPPGRVIEAVVMENYLRAGISVVYVLFPSSAIPEAIYGMSIAAAEWHAGKWQQANYEEMVDELYAGATFEKTNGQWRVKSLSYDPSGRGAVSVSRAEAYSLPRKVPYLSNVLVPQVSLHPAIKMYHELLELEAISDGQISSTFFASWPRRYRNLSLYGERLWQEYVQEVDTVTRQYFAEVIQELEKRHAFLQGAGSDRIQEIEKELGCSESLLQLTGDQDRDRPSMESLIDDWDELQAVRKNLRQLREHWRASFIVDRQAVCSVKSIQNTLDRNTKDIKILQKAEAQATVAVEEIVGRDLADFATLQPAVRARMGAMIFSSGSKERRSMIDEYKRYLDSLRPHGTEPGLRIVGPSQVEEGVPVEFAAVLDREARKVRYDWQFENGGENEQLPNPKQARITWTPSSPGEKKLVAWAKLDMPDAEWVWTTHKVTVLSEQDVPRPVVQLSAPVSEFTAGEICPVRAEMEQYGLGGRGFQRYFWYVDGRQISASADNIFSFDGVGYEGRQVTVSVQARSVGHKEKVFSDDSIKLNVLAPETDNQQLRVHIEPELTEMPAGAEVPFKAIVLARKDGGELRYQWAVNNQVVGNKDSIRFESAQFADQSVTISVYVQQATKDGEEVLYEGQAVRTIDVVQQIPISVSLQPYPRTVNDTQDIEICVAEPRPELNYEWYEWNWVGDRWGDNTIGTNRCMRKSARGLAGQKLRFQLTATDKKRGRIRTLETDEIAVTEPRWDTSDEQREKGPETGPETDPEEVSSAEEPPDLSELEEERHGKSKTEQSKEEEEQETGQEEKPIKEPSTELGSSPTDIKDKKAQEPSLDDLVFSGSVPGIWEGGNFERDSRRGCKFERTTASMQNKDTEKCPQKASVWAEMWGKLNPSFHPQTEEEIRSELEEEIKTKKWEDIARLRPLRMQDFSGWFYDIEVDYSKGWANPMIGYHPSGVDVHGHGYVLKGRKCIEVKYGIGGSGCYNNSDRAFLESQARAARSEARGIIASLKLVPNGEFTTVPYTGPKLDGSDLLQVEIKPAVTGPYRAGQVVELQAAVSGGKAPYTYVWEGNLGTSGRQGPSASFTATKPDTYPVAVTVRDSVGTEASAGRELEVEALQAEVKGVLPEVVYGQTAVLSVDVKGGLPDGGTGPQSVQVGENQAYVPNPDEEGEGSGLIFIWQSSPELAFAPGTTSVPSTTVTYDRMGPVKIWAEILSQEGEVRTTIGETPQVTARVQAPAFHISFDPKQGRVGQDVRARIASEPAVADDLIDYRWFSPKSSNRMEYADNSGVIGFTIPESGKMDLRVLARVPVHGDEICEITAGYTGGGYQVQVTVQEQGPPARTWDPKTGGLVKIPQGSRATGARIFLRAELVGQPQPEAVRWQWTVNEGTFISNDISRTPTVSRSKPGTISAQVEARNAKDQLLGTGSINLPVVAVQSGPGTGEEPPSKSSGKISVQSATYGGNCGVDPGNVTDHIAKACNGKSECTYTVDYKVIGDPASGCKKTYVVTYRCGTDSELHEESLSVEAGWGDKSVVLKCPTDEMDSRKETAGQDQVSAGDMSGWKAANAGFEANPGQISASPAADGKTSYYTAPDALLGNWSNVTHILLEKKSSGGRYYTGSHGDIGDIVLQGPNGSASYRLSEDHSGEWQAYRVPLDGSGWTFADGAKNMADIIANVTSFRIRAEYGYGADTSAIRGVELIRQ
ncbi:MAG: laminin B domain-containing protein [Desulfovermiculus sp.]